MNIIDSKILRKPIVVGYLRVSTDKQTITAQKLSIYEYARTNNLSVDRFFEVVVSSSKSSEKRKIDELLSSLSQSDTLIVSELSRLGRSTVDLLTLVRNISELGIKLIVIKQNLVLDKKDSSLSNKIILTIFSMLAEIEKDLIIQRTKEGLIAARLKGKTLGKPKGTIQSSVFDNHKQQINSYLKKELPVASIAKLLGLTSNETRNLQNYIRRRNLKELINNENTKQ